MRVIFFGNHTVGLIVLKEFFKQSEIVAVFAHPDNSDDGILYESVREWAQYSCLKVYKPDGVKGGGWERLMLSLKPDLIVIADYKYIIPENIITIPNLGAINFHPSILPKYRGRAPVNWAMINGEDKVGLTVHFIDKGVDSGPIIDQKIIKVSFEDTIKDVHEKYFPVYKKLANAIVAKFITGNLKSYPQNILNSNAIYPARYPDDGIVCWKNSSLSIYNLIRAVTHPYPGAFTFARHQKIMLWKAVLLSFDSNSVRNQKPGEIIRVGSKSIDVSTGDGIIRITKFSLEKGNISNVLFKDVIYQGQKLR
jgi:methionyl-tRNA formyltransferase